MKKTVVVTGTSRGLGQKIAEDLISNGYFVVGVSRSTNLELLEQTANYAELLFDFSKIQEIPEFCSRIVERHGSPFALVNNAAIGSDGLLATQNNKEIEHTLSTNLLAPILLTKYLSRQMLQNREGRVVNISSIVASTGYRGLSVYAATKAGLLGFSRSLSRELGPRGVTVNAIQPGFMHTDMTTKIGEEHLQKIERRSPLGRLADLRDISSMVVHLLGEGGKNITGQTFVIDAGNSA